MSKTFQFGNGEWAVGKETALAYNDENSNFKPLPFTFDRASTATVVNKQGLIETVGTDEPRIDFLNNTKGHLLLEPERLNVATYSEDFSNAVWNTWQVTKTELNNLNPKGINGYYEISHTGSSTDNPNTRLTNVSLNGSYTLSVFVKTNQSRYISLSIEDYDGDRARVYFDTVNKTFTTIANVGSPVTNTSYSEFSNQWIRITLSANLSSAVYNEIGVGIYNPSGSFLPASGEVISIFGAQLEQGSYATSYIPTQGSAVTRSAETCYQENVTQVIGQSEGTMYIEFVPKDTSATQILYQVRTTGSSNIGLVDIRLDGGNIFTLANDGGLNQFNINGGSYLAGTTYKIAARYKYNDSKIYINGVSSGSDTNCIFTSSSLNQISFNANLSNFLPVADILDARLYNTALNDNELQSLTS